MTPAAFKAARRRLGLSVQGLAAVLRQTDRNVRRMETPAGAQSHRPVSGMTSTFIRILLGDYGQTLPAILRNLQREDQDRPE